MPGNILFPHSNPGWGLWRLIKFKWSYESNAWPQFELQRAFQLQKWTGVSSVLAPVDAEWTSRPFNRMGGQGMETNSFVHPLTSSRISWHSCPEGAWNFTSTFHSKSVNWSLVLTSRVAWVTYNSRWYIIIFKRKRRAKTSTAAPNVCVVLAAMP